MGKLNKKTLIRFVIIIIAIFSIGVSLDSMGVNLDPRKYSFEKDILDKYVKGNVERVNILKGNSSILIEDKDKVSKIIEDLSKAKMLKYKKDLPKGSKEVNWISICDRDGLAIGLTVYNEDFMEVLIASEKYNNHTTYKILDDSLNMDYIESLSQ